MHSWYRIFPIKPVIASGNNMVLTVSSTLMFQAVVVVGKRGQMRISIRGVCKNCRARPERRIFRWLMRGVQTLRLYSVAGDKDIVD